MGPAARFSRPLLDPSQRTALTLLALLAAVITLGLTAGPAILGDARDRAAQDAVSNLTAAERGIRVTTRTADDPTSQLGQAAEALDALVAGDGAGAVEILTTRLTYPLSSSAGERVVAAHIDGWLTRVTLVAGAPPAGRPGGTLEVAAPAAAGLAVGTELTVGDSDTPVLVTALWEPLSPSDPDWFGDPGLTAGTMTDQGGAVGPLLTATPDDVSGLADRPLQRWTVAPRTDTMTADDAAALATALDGVQGALRDAGALVQGSTLDGEGPAHLAAIAEDLRRARALTTIPLLVATAAALVALAAAAGAFTSSTRPERDLLLARGARGWWIARRDLRGILVATTVGAVVGAAAGMVAASAISLVGGGAGDPRPGALTAVLIAAATAAATATLALALSRRRLPVDRATRAYLPAVGVALVLASAGVTTWQLLRGGPVEPSGEADLLAAASPALLLAIVGATAAWLVALRRGGSPLLEGTALALAGGALTVAVTTALSGPDLSGPAPGPHQRPLALAWALGATATVTFAALTLRAGSRRRRATTQEGDALAQNLAVDRPPATTTGRLTRAVCWVAATAAGSGVALALAPLILGVAS